MPVEFTHTQKPVNSIQLLLMNISVGETHWSVNTLFIYGDEQTLMTVCHESSSVSA